jgi:hypothetical protein
MNAELIKALRACGNFEDRDGCDEECPYFNDKDCPKRIMHDAADAIERLTAEIDRKDKAIQGLLTQIESKDKAIERMRDLMKHYKAAYRTAYKLYQEVRNEQQP